MASERNNFEHMDEVDKQIILGYLGGFDKDDLTGMILGDFADQEDLDAIVEDYKRNMDTNIDDSEELVLPNFAGIKKRLIKEYLVEFCDGGNMDGFNQEELVVIKKFLDDIVQYTEVASIQLMPPGSYNFMITDFIDR